MEFRFTFVNDSSEPADLCVRCHHFTTGRCHLRFPGIRLMVYACRPCLGEISYLLWWLHESPFRAFLKSKELDVEGQPEFRGVIHENSFHWFGGNGSPLPGRKTNNTMNGNGAHPRKEK